MVGPPRHPGCVCAHLRALGLHPWHPWCRMALGGAIFIVLLYLSRWGRLETVSWMVLFAPAFASTCFFKPTSAALAHMGRASSSASPRRIAEKSVRKWWWLRACCRLSASGPSSRSNGRSACGITSGRHPARRRIDLRPAAQHLPAESPLHDGAVIIQDITVTPQRHCR